MKNICINKYLVAVTAVIASLVSCTRIEEQEIPDVAPKVHMTFSADIEGNADTKTVLGGQMGDTYRKLLWEPQDSIGITSSLSNASFDKFVNIETSLSGVGTFEGSTIEGSTYYLFYPYSSTLSTKDGDKITFKLPSAQVYDENSFSSDAMPMVSKGTQGESYRFYSLGGVFALNLTGSETVKSVSFTGKDASGNHLPVSGEFSVNMNYEEFPEIVAGETVSASVSLNCGEGVTLDPSKPTPFYMVLPVARYESFTIMVSTADGKVMMKEVNKTLDIKRATVTKTASLAYVASETINLSASGWANCYVVSEPGLYSFDATVIGNGDFGMIEEAGFHTQSTSITPASAEIVWEDVPGVVSVPSFDGKRINFMTSGIEGNALVAARNAEGTIVWSWHIWVTDMPVEQIYENSVGTFTVLDRNLGAIRADRGTGDEWLDSRGLVYFWGRKDPFWYGAYDHIQGSLTLENAIENPNKRHKKDSWIGGETSWMVEHNPYLWSADTKTIYDPCPHGYRVACYDVWKGFTVTGLASKIVSEFNVKGSYDNGWEFYIDKDKSMTAWYPTGYSFESTGGHNMTPWRSGVWASDYYRNSYKKFFGYNASNVQIDNHLNDDGYACSIRCMKDDGYVDMSVPVVEVVDFRDVTETSVKVVANVKHSGASTLTEKGIIWGLSEDLADGTKVICESDTDEYVVELTGLERSTKYYVKPYAVNAHGESTGSVKAFRTKYSNIETDLSSLGTANSYIVRYPGTYSFDCTVKGNSDESVGIPVSAEVLWETDNTSTSISEGDIVYDVQLGENGRVIFDATGEPGNALIAVKDALGVILWSWHIWITDFDPEQTAQTYSSGAVMMDRNLGALNVERGDVLSWGLLYQQGRKDPFIGCGDIEAKTFAATFPSGVFSYSGSGDDLFIVQNPYVATRDYNFDWADEKTKNDPCPVGWKVPSSPMLAGLTDGDTSLPYSMIFTSPLSSPDAYFPLTGDTENGRQVLRDPGTTSYLWTTEEGYPYCIHLGTRQSRSMYDENPVRCVKDDEYFKLLFPQVELVSFSEITETSVKIIANVISEGKSEVTERGIIWGADPELSDGFKVSCGNGAGEFSCELTGLESGSIYYVKAYAVNDHGESYTDVRVFSTRYSDEDAVDLSKYETANSYIVSSPGLYIINCLVKGNSVESVGAPVSAAVVWETKNTDAPVSTGDIIDNVALHGGYLSFEIPTPFTPGNALVAVKDASGTILWSWHIWVTDFDPDITVQTYISGAKMMDRNLGALRNTSGDPSVNGFFYQWGRKDPLLNAVSSSAIISAVPSNVKNYVEADVTSNTMEYSIQHPSTVVVNPTWMAQDNLWALNKTMYDPCPAGWRIPGSEVWEGISENDYADNGFYIPSPYSEPAAFYPGTGYIEGRGGDILYYNSVIYVWSSTTPNMNDAYTMCMFGNAVHDMMRPAGKATQFPVRCQMMESGYSVDIIDLVSEAQSSVTVKAKVSVVRDCKIEETGIVYSTTDYLPTVDVNEGKIESDSTKAGEFECTVSGIKRQTKYYIRPYVSGDKGVKYGKVVEYIERSPGSGEGFTGDDFVWE